MKLSNGLIFQNLQLIDNCGNQGLNCKKFIDEKGTNSDPSVLVDYLLKYDLIEFGELEGHFYLTDIGYEAIEQGVWLDPIFIENEAPLKTRELNYSSESTPEVKVNKKTEPISKLQAGFILSALVGIGGYFISGPISREQRIDFPSLDGLKIQLDSIASSKHNKPVYIIEEGAEDE